MLRRVFVLKMFIRDSFEGDPLASRCALHSQAGAAVTAAQGELQADRAEHRQQRAQLDRRLPHLDRMDSPDRNTGQFGGLLLGRTQLLAPTPGGEA